MRGPPLDTAAGKYLVRAVKSSGARGIAFVGGDPSLRPDIADLINDARSLGLWIEVQTNGQQQPVPFLSALLSVNSVGVSLDGPDAETHDRFRDQPGNFDRVTSLLLFLQRHGIPVIVRSIVALHNNEQLVRLATVLSRFGNVKRWVLMEFVPVGEGYANRDSYLLDREKFDETVSRARASAGAQFIVDAYYRENHSGTYALVTPDGRVYGTPTDGIPKRMTIGSLISDHLNTLANELAFSAEKHGKRYAECLSIGQSDQTRSHAPGSRTPTC